MKRLLLVVISVLFVSELLAQDIYKSALQEIEKNSVMLKALSEQMEAQKLDAKSGLTPSNPEIEYTYLWARPESLPNDSELAVMQSIDFPTAYAAKRKIANLSGKGAELTYKSERMALLLSAKELLIELVYLNAEIKMHREHWNIIDSVAVSYRKRFAAGEVSRSEYNLIRFYFTNEQNTLDVLVLERDAVLSELKRLNGGKDIVFENTAYPEIVKLGDFDSWYDEAEKRNPILGYLRNEVEISDKQVKSVRADALPKISAGYKLANAGGDRFNGVVVGVSIPLWENKNRVRKAKADVVVANSVVKDNMIEYYNQLFQQFNTAVSLRKCIIRLKNLKKSYSNKETLDKELAAGEINYIQYIEELHFYTHTKDAILESERDIELALAKLYEVEL